MKYIDLSVWFNQIDVKRDLSSVALILPQSGSLKFGRIP